MKKRIPIALAAAIIAAAALIYLYFTEEGKGSGIPCPFYAVTGLYCGGCGASRALRSIMHLDFIQALRYNAPFTVFVPLVAIYFLSVGVSLVLFGKDRVSEKVPIAIPIFMASVTIVYGILRNIALFSFLAPTVI